MLFSQGKSLFLADGKLKFYFDGLSLLSPHSRNTKTSSQPTYDQSRISYGHANIAFNFGGNTCIAVTDSSTPAAAATRTHTAA